MEAAAIRIVHFMRKTFVAIAIAVSASLSGTTLAHASVVLSDDFTRSNGTNISGTAPGVVDVPGGSYWVNPYWSNSVQNNTLQLQADLSAIVTLGSYANSVLSFTTSLSLGNLSGSGGNRGVGIGLNSAAHGNSDSFSGLRLDPTGALTLMSNFTQHASVTAFGAGFDESIFHTLSYSVDTATGAVSNIQLSGSTADFSALVTASQAANYFTGYGYASLQAGGKDGGEFGYFDSFQVSSSINVAEPASLALFGVGLFGLGLGRRQLSRRLTVTS